MKKATMILSVVLVITLAISGCTEGSNITAGFEPYSVLVYGFSNSVPSANHEIEYAFADYDKYGKTLPTNRVECLINGQEYVGDFQSSQYIGYNYFPVHSYTGPGVFSFGLDESGNLATCFWGNSDATGKVKTQEECLEIAKNFLSGIIDISPYDITVEDEADSKLYRFCFTKSYNGVVTTDTATVVVDYEGNLYSYSSFMLGRVDTDSISFDVANLAKVKEAVIDRLGEIYQEAKKVYSRVDYSEPGIKLTLLKDGTLGAVCWVDVSCVTVSGENDMIISERISFVVALD